MAFIVSPNENIILPFTKDKKNILSFNGEIYNFREIKDFNQKIHKISNRNRHRGVI